MMEPLETKRLVLREFTLDDASFILELVNDPGWLEFIGDKQVSSLSDAERYLSNGPLQMYSELGFGLYCVVLKELHAPIGMCGILKRDSLEHVDLGFAFLPDYRQQGFAFEAAKKTLEYAKDFLNQTTVDAIALQRNEKSTDLLERLGFQLQRLMTVGNESQNEVLYSIDLAPIAS